MLEREQERVRGVVVRMWRATDKKKMKWRKRIGDKRCAKTDCKEEGSAMLQQITL